MPPPIVASAARAGNPAAPGRRCRRTRSHRSYNRPIARAADTPSAPPFGGGGSAYSPDAGLPFDPEALESRLTWIWGSPRSGSTWLLQQLCHPLHPDPTVPLGFRAPDEGAEGPYDAIPVDETFLSNHLAPALGDPREVEGVYVPGTLNNYLGEKPTYAFSEEHVATWRPEVRRLILTRLYGPLARAAAEGVPLASEPAIVIKEVNGSHAADVVMGALPRSRILFLVRDGRDVVDSLLHAYQPGGFLARNQGVAVETPEQRAEALAWACRLWSCNVDTTLRAIAGHDAERCRTVRYEDLLADPAAELRDLFGWLGLERSVEWTAEMVAERSFGSLPERLRGERTRNRAARPGLWRENLSADEQRLAGEIMGPRLERFGYEL